MLKLSIIGQDTLAAAAIECCKPHFDVATIPRSDADIVWFCYDTPIGADDKPDVQWVLDRIREQMVDLGPAPLILTSSQLPVGTTAMLERDFPGRPFAHSPENIRVKTAVKDFMLQSRVVVGVRNDARNYIIERLFLPFTRLVIFTDPETAEMAKAAMNCFLALNIAYINEIARLCRVVGANAEHVSLALRTEQRVSPKAPLRPGAPFGGGHLAREIFNMCEIAKANGVWIPLIAHLNESNEVAP